MPDKVGIGRGTGRLPQRLAGQLWQTFPHLVNGERVREITELLSFSERSIQSWTKEAWEVEKEQQQAKASDLWLDCSSYREIGELIGVHHKTVSDWCGELAKSCGDPSPDSLQYFDVWDFNKSAGESTYFGKMPPQAVENLLWLYTEPGQIVFDPFACGGTTIDVAKSSPYNRGSGGPVI